MDRTTCIDAVGGHGVRESFIRIEGIRIEGIRIEGIRIEGRATAFAHPTRLCITSSQKKIGPCLRLWARGSPSFLFSVSLETEGDGAPQGA
jgi:hypothetical protein